MTTTATTPTHPASGVDRYRIAPTSHPELLAWVGEMAALTTPDRIHWCTGDDREFTELTDQLVAVGTLQRLDPSAHPHSFLARTDPDDVARVEDRTFLCTEDPDVGPTNNWADPVVMRQTLTGLFAGSMRGRTLYVVPFCMGSLDAEDPKFAVEITDSAYVAVSMGIMARMGREVLDAMTAGEQPADFVRCLHSVGAPRRDGEPDTAWPCNRTKYISHFPATREVWSYGSGYGGNSLLGKKCFALRIASAMARDEGWLAEHMLIIKLTSPEGRSHHLAAAFPSACGKTNLAMMEPSLPGWKVETIGDDIAWLRFDDTGRLRAVNPEAGFFGVAPGTGWQTNPHAMETIARGNTIFTNVAVSDDGRVWWEGMTPEPPTHLTDWTGQAWTPDSGRPAAHPNSRFCTPIQQCPTLAPEYDDPAGVPIDAIIVGGRRASTIPLVAQARNWEHGVFMAATLSSETTAAATGQVGVVRRDPMAMRPFLGLGLAQYLQHWLDLGRDRTMPEVFCVNWFRKDAEGRFLWPGFGENSRVLAWIAARLDGEAEAIESPVGDLPVDLHEACRYDAGEWAGELNLISAWFDEIGPDLPGELTTELVRLRAAVTAA